MRIDFNSTKEMAVPGMNNRTDKVNESKALGVERNLGARGFSYGDQYLQFRPNAVE